MKALAAIVMASVLAACSNKPEAVPVELVQLDTAVVQVLALARVEPNGGVVELASPVQGILAEQRVLEGEPVTRGTIIAQLDNTVQQAELAQAEARAAAGSASVQAIRAQVTTAQADLDQARTDEQRVEALFSKGGMTGQQRDDAVVKARTAQLLLDQRQAELQQAIAKQKEQAGDVARARAHAEQRIIRAPGKGTLLSFALQPGEAVNVAGVLGEFAPDTSLVARAEVDELYATRLTIGLEAWVRSQVNGDTLATGRIQRVGTLLKRRSIFSDEGDTEDRRVREVIVVLEPRTTLLPGSKVEVLISLRP
jgi:HlyD family secretion protein